MPDVSSIAPAEVKRFVVFDVHKNSLVAGMLPGSGGTPEVTRLENTARAVRRFVDRLGGPDGLAVAYEAGPCGYDLFRLLSRIGVACDVIAPSLVPVRAGDRVKTDRRDAKRLVRLYRAGELSFVAPPSPEYEGLRDLIRCRDDLRRARTAARHRVAKQLLRHGHVYRDGKKAWTKQHQAWLQRQRLDDPLAQRALAHTCSATSTVSTPSSPRSITSSSRSPPPSRGPIRCAGCARSAASGWSPRSGCSPRSATSAASATRAS